MLYVDGGGIHMKRQQYNSEKLYKVSVQKVHMMLRSCKCVKVLNEDQLINMQFRRSMKMDAKKRAEMNAPIAKYDTTKKLAYLEYPDGRIVYVNET